MTLPEIEFDVRKYIVLILKFWPMILIFTLLPVLVAYLVLKSQPDIYLSTATVVVTRPNYSINFDPRMGAVNNLEPVYKGYQDVAESEQVLRSVYQEGMANLDLEMSFEEFVSTATEVAIGSDPSYIQLSVSTNSSEKSARLADFWARTFVQLANSIYGTQSEDFLVFIEEQLADSKSDLDDAENQYITFQKENILNVASNRLVSMLQKQKDYLAIARNLDYVEYNANGLMAQLKALPANNPTSRSDELSVLLIKLQTFNNEVQEIEVGNTFITEEEPQKEYGSISTTQLYPVEFDVSSLWADAETLTIGDQIRVLEDVTDVINSQQQLLEANLQAIDSKVFDLQQQVSEYESKERQLVLNREVAQENFATLLRKLKETQIITQEDTGQARYALIAVPSETPESKHLLQNSALAGIAGGILGVMIAFVIVWWKGSTYK